MEKKQPFRDKVEFIYDKDIELVYKKTIDLMMFAWVTSITEVLPAVGQKQAIGKFLEWMELSEDEYPSASAKAAYLRMKNKFIWRTKK